MSHPLRTVLFVGSLGPGGAERSLVEPLPYLLANGVLPHFVCLQRPRTEILTAAVEAAGVPITYLVGPSLAHRALAFKQFLGREKWSLVHTSMWNANLTGRFARTPGIPVLNSLTNTMYDPVRREDPNVRGSRLGVVQLIDAVTGRFLVTHFHAVSSAVKESAVAALRLPPDRITVIERGRDPVRLGRRTPARRAAVRAGLGIADDRPILINVGRQDFQKGQDLLIEAFHQVIKLRPDAELWLVGREGHGSGDIRARLNRLGLNDSVRCLGYRDDVPDLLSAADVFVFSSRYEGFPGAIVEAMALELPVVASAIASNSCLVREGQTGHLVRTDREFPSRMAQVVVDLLKEPQRRQAFGRRARQIFEAELTLDRYAERMLALYHRLAVTGS